MSSLLAGPSSINPWIEDVCFHALTQRRGPTPQRPRLVQVRAMRLSMHSTRPSLLVIHDGKTLGVAFIRTKLSPSDKNGLPTRGCIVRISDWNVSLVEHCTTHVQEVLHSSNSDIVSSFLNPNPRICLDVGKIEVIGGHGIGIVGNPTAVHQSVEVRRALMNLESKGISLEQQLQLVGPCSTPRLGNVQELFANDGNRNMIETLLAVPKDGIGGVSCKKSATIPSTNDTNGTRAGVVLGDVSGLLESLRNDSSENNFFARIMNQSGTRVNTDRSTFTEPATTSNANRNVTDNTVLGNVRDALAAGTDSSMADALFAAASGSSTRQQDSTNGTSVANQAQQVEPYGIRERFETRASVVSLSGISNVLRSLVSGRNSFLEPEQKESGVEEAKVADTTDDIVNGNENKASTQSLNATEARRENGSDSDSEVLGISDMLISHTQEVPEDAVAIQETSEGNTRTDTDEVEAETTTQVTVTGEKLVPGSLVDHVETADALDDSDTPAHEISVTDPNKTKDAMEKESTLQDAGATTAGSNVYCVETVHKETEVETRVIEETNARQNTELEAPETQSSKKRPSENDQDEEDDEEETIANEFHFATQPETQPPLQPSDEDGIQANRDNDKTHDETTNVARLAVPKKDLVSTKSKRPKKKRRKGMLNLWKAQRARRKEKLQSDK